MFQRKRHMNYPEGAFSHGDSLVEWYSFRESLREIRGDSIVVILCEPVTH